MEEEEIPNFNSINHRSIESASNTDLLINISILTFIPKIITFGGIIVIIISIFLLFIKRHLLDYISLSLGGILFIIGIIFFKKLKYKFNFSFKGEKLKLNYGGLTCLINPHFCSIEDLITISSATLFPCSYLPT